MEGGLTVDVEFRELAIERRLCDTVLQELILDGADEAATERIKIYGKFRDVELCSFPVSLVQDILAAQTEGGGIARLGKSGKALGGRVL